ncbi:MAG: DUF86 domain-containing protein [Halanaerobium sp.]|nr:DUF86 domain-containing protein [Halanaerobium sp.]
MVRIEVLQQRISKAGEYLEFLDKIRDKYTLEEFKADPMVYASSERFLHLTIEALIDIGNHIIADKNLGKVEQYKDIPNHLFTNGYLSQRARDIFFTIIGFRNILVHDYLKVDLEIVYSVIKNDLDDLKEILMEYAQLL